MKTTITYNVDKLILENAVRVCINEGKSPNIKNVKASINDFVYTKGIFAIHFPECWYVEDEEIRFYPQEKIDKMVEKLVGRIK